MERAASSVLPKVRADVNRRGFFRGLLASAAIIPSVSTKTIVDLAANTWRAPTTLGISSVPARGEFYRIPEGSDGWVFPEHLTLAAILHEWHETGHIFAPDSLRVKAP